MIYFVTIDGVAMQLHGLVLFDEKEEQALLFSHTIMRYIILSYVLSIKRISKVVKEIFPSHEELIKTRLVTRDELSILESEGDLEKIWWIPLCWGMTLVNR